MKVRTCLSGDVGSVRVLSYTDWVYDRLGDNGLDVWRGLYSVLLAEALRHHEV